GVIERVVVNGAEFFALDVADAVGGVDQQYQRGFVERKRDGVDGEIAAAQVFVNGGGSNLWARAGLGESLFVRAAHLRRHAAGEQQIDGLQVVIGRNDFRAEFFLRQLGEFESAALHSKIQIANREAAERVAHGAAGQEYTGASFGGELPHLPDH